MFFFIIFANWMIYNLKLALQNVKLLKKRKKSERSKLIPDLVWSGSGEWCRLSQTDAKKISLFKALSRKWALAVNNLPAWILPIHPCLPKSKTCYKQKCIFSFQFFLPLPQLTPIHLFGTGWRHCYIPKTVQSWFSFRN